MLPERANMERGGIRGRLPDTYGARLRELASSGLDVVDGRQILERRGASTPELFHRDGKHLSARENKILAETILDRVTQK